MDRLAHVEVQRQHRRDPGHDREVLAEFDARLLAARDQQRVGHALDHDGILQLIGRQRPDVVLRVARDDQADRVVIARRELPAAEHGLDAVLEIEEVVLPGHRRQGLVDLLPVHGLEDLDRLDRHIDVVGGLDRMVMHAHDERAGRRGGTPTRPGRSSTAACGDREGDAQRQGSKHAGERRGVHGALPRHEASRPTNKPRP